MTVMLTVAAGIAVLAGVSVLAAFIRRRLGVRDPHPNSESQRMTEAEVITRTGGPFV